MMRHWVSRVASWGCRGPQRAICTTQCVFQRGQWGGQRGGGRRDYGDQGNRAIMAVNVVAADVTTVIRATRAIMAVNVVAADVTTVIRATRAIMAVNVVAADVTTVIRATRATMAVNVVAADVTTVVGVVVRGIPGAGIQPVRAVIEVKVVLKRDPWKDHLMSGRLRTFLS
ncbi:mitochondrial binding protein TBRGG1 [Trypanosoma cruzi]|nr:mitochondrial binding protein TBRGG1 [Trypanosoma cruzi]